MINFLLTRTPMQWAAAGLWFVGMVLLTVTGALTPLEFGMQCVLFVGAAGFGYLTTKSY
jgi:hypothetical protein